MLTCETVETARRIDSGRLAMVEDELSCRRKGVVRGGEDGGFDRHWCESGIHFFGLEVREEGVSWFWMMLYRRWHRRENGNGSLRTTIQN